MRILTIEATPFGLLVPMTPDGCLKAYPDVNITPYNKRFVEFKFDTMIQRRIVSRKFFYYDKKTEILYLPRYGQKDFGEYLEMFRVELRVKDKLLSLGKSVDIQMKSWFKPMSELQAGAIDYASGENPDLPMRPIAIQTGGGKVGHMDSSVKIPGGWRRMGDLEVGDEVTAADGTPTYITGVYDQGLVPMTRLTFEDGRSTRACTQHLWTYHTDADPVYRTDTTSSIMRDMLTTTAYIPLTRSVENPPVELERDPYQWGHTLDCKPHDIETLERGSKEQREAFIRGMMDATQSTDGRIRTVSSSQEFSSNIVDLVRSTGGIASSTFTPNGYVTDLQCRPDGHLRVSDITPLGDMPGRCISIAHPSELYLTDDYIVTHNTATAIAAIAKMGRRAMICVPGMIDQWVKSILNFTSLNENEIYIIQGIQSFAKLMARIDKSLFPKIIVISVTTLRMYCDGTSEYSAFPPFDTLCDHLGVGVRVIDEAHLNFQANLIADLRLNNAVTIPLTATFDNSSQEVVEIFDRHYPKAIRYGESAYKRYVDIYSYSYGLSCDIPPKAFRGKDGYSHILFEGFLLSKRGKDILEDIVNRVYLPIIHSHYINVAAPGEKLLVLCSTIEMCKYLLTVIRREFPDRKSDIYKGGTKDDVLELNDIIVSTPRSAGTGRDIKKLRTAFATVSVRSPPLNKQMLGRLRILPDGATPIYVYCHCRDIPPQVSHAETRAQILGPLGKTFRAFNFP